MNDTVQEEIDAMKAEHRRLDEEILAISAEPPVNQLEVARLKRRKLMLKDRIQRMLDQRTPDIIA